MKNECSNHVVEEEGLSPMKRAHIHLAQYVSHVKEVSNTAGKVLLVFGCRWRFNLLFPPQDYEVFHRF